VPADARRRLQLGISHYNVSATIKMYVARTRRCTMQPLEEVIATMRRSKIARGESLATRSGRAKGHRHSRLRHGHAKMGEASNGQVPGLRERKKARLRQQIIDTAVKLFRKHGYDNTRIDDIVEILEISQPTFFRYFPTKDAVLREVGRRGFACQMERLKIELSSKATTAERLRRFYRSVARSAESDRPLWQAVVLSGAMDPIRSPDMREPEQATVQLLREILDQGQANGEVTRDFPIVHLAEFMEGLYTTVVRQWAVDLTGPHKLTERVDNAVEFFIRAVKN
jgi:AcrR family transcriptional regulator